MAAEKGVSAPVAGNATDAAKAIAASLLSGERKAILLGNAAAHHANASNLLAVQAVVFAIGALRGPRQHPYGLIFANFVAPRLSPVTEREPVPPLQFAQLVGLIFAAVGVAGFVFGAPLLGVVATAFALFAAFLNAAFGICLGCQLYPLVHRVRRIST